MCMCPYPAQCLLRQRYEGFDGVQENLNRLGRRLKGYGSVFRAMLASTKDACTQVSSDLHENWIFWEMAWKLFS